MPVGCEGLNTVRLSPPKCFLIDCATKQLASRSTNLMRAVADRYGDETFQSSRRLV
jgi:hypothetical protein